MTLYVLAEVEHDYNYYPIIFKCSISNPTQACTYILLESLNEEYDDGYDIHGLTMTSAKSVAFSVETYSTPKEYYIHTYSV